MKILKKYLKNQKSEKNRKIKSKIKKITKRTKIILELVIDVSLLSVIMAGRTN